MLLKLCTNAGFSEYRVVQEYTNLNYRVPKIAGSGFSGRILATHADPRGRDGDGVLSFDRPRAHLRRQA